MNISKSKRFAVFALLLILTTNIFFVSPPQAQALIPVTDIPGHILQGIQSAMTSLSNLALGLPGTGSALKGGVGAAKTPCKIAEKANKIASSVDSFAAADVLAGSVGQLQVLQTRIAAVTIVQNCYQAVLDLIETPGGAGSSLAAASGISGMVAISGDAAELQAHIDKLDDRLEILKQLRRDAVKEIWKGVAIRILYDVQQKVATDMVNKLIQKYKIGNYIDYADAVATQVYSVDYINKNIKDGQDQAVARSLMNSQFTRSEILPMVRIQAEQNLGFDPATVNWDVNDFYNQMARVGSAGAQDWFMQNRASEQAGLATTMSQTLANQEISSGGGFMPVRNCRDVSAQQRTFDKMNVDFQMQFWANQEALLKLQNQRTLDPNSVSAAEWQKAIEALGQSRIKLQDLPKTNTAFVKVCDDVQNPGYAVSNQITSFLQSHLNSANRPSSQNLPFFAKFVENVAANFLSNIIEGGKPNLNFIGGNAGVTPGNILPSQVVGTNPQTQFLKDADTASVAQSVVFSASPTPIPGQYTVSWDASAFSNVTSIAITGATTLFTALGAKGTATLQATPPATLTLKVIGQGGAILSSATAAVQAEKTVNLNVLNGNTLDNADQQTININNSQTGPGGIIPPEPPVPVCNGVYASPQECLDNNPNNPSRCDNLCGGVLGASMVQPLSSVRGPAVEFHPRGK